MEADTTYQSSEAETEIDDSDESKYEERTDENMSQGQVIVRDSNICSVQMMVKSYLEIEHRNDFI